MEPEIFHQSSKPVSPCRHSPSDPRAVVGTSQAAGGLSRSLRRGRPLVVEEAHGGACCCFYCPKGWETERTHRTHTPSTPKAGGTQKEEWGYGQVFGRGNH